MQAAHSAGADDGCLGFHDDVLAGVVNARTSAICLVGKTHDFHVKKALGVTLDENAFMKKMITDINDKLAKKEKLDKARKKGNEDILPDMELQDLLMKWT